MFARVKRRDLTVQGGTNAERRFSLLSSMETHTELEVVTRVSVEMVFQGFQRRWCAIMVSALRGRFHCLNADLYGTF